MLQRFMQYLIKFVPIDILVFTEIGRKNLALVEGIFPNYVFHFGIPEKIREVGLVFI